MRACGYKLRAQLDQNDQICSYWAYHDGHEFVSDSPVALLGLTAIYEHFGADWQQGLNERVLDDLPLFHCFFVECEEDDNGCDGRLVYDGDDDDKQPQ
jgi:hypothetical protein